MKKFTRGALACAALVPCMMGLSACDNNNKYDGKDAFAEVSNNIATMTDTFSSFETEGSEFQLNINFSLTVDSYMANQKLADQSGGIQLRAIMGAQNGATKDFVLGDIGVAFEADKDAEFYSLMSAYLVDSVSGVTEYAPAVVTAQTFDTLKSTLFIKTPTGYQTVGTDATFSSTQTYYVVTDDIMHLYLNANSSLFDGFNPLTVQPDDWATNYANYYKRPVVVTTPPANSVEYNATSVADYVSLTQAEEFVAEKYYEKVTDISINDLLYELMGMEVPIEEGKMYATLNTQALTQEPEVDEPDHPDIDDPEDTVDVVTDLLEGDLTYDQFVASFANSGATVTGNKASNGDANLVVTQEGMVITITAKAQGGLTFSIVADQTTGGSGVILSFVIDFDINQELDVNFESDYVPTNLEVYGESQGDILELIGNLLQ